MTEQIQQHVADIGAAISTGAVAAYTFTNFLEDTALVVAIVSGTLAAIWHAVKLYKQFRGGANDQSDSG